MCSARRLLTSGLYNELGLPGSDKAHKAKQDAKDDAKRATAAYNASLPRYGAPRDPIEAQLAAKVRGKQTLLAAKGDEAPAATTGKTLLGA